MLITTLIGLDNFYRHKKVGKNLLKSNYFLWMVLFIIIISIIICGLVKDKEFKNEITNNATTNNVIKANESTEAIKATNVNKQKQTGSQ